MCARVGTQTHAVSHCNPHWRLIHHLQFHFQTALSDRSPKRAAGERVGVRARGVGQSSRLPKATGVLQRLNRARRNGKACGAVQKPIIAGPHAATWSSGELRFCHTTVNPLPSMFDRTSVSRMSHDLRQPMLLGLQTRIPCRPHLLPSRTQPAAQEHRHINFAYCTRSRANLLIGHRCDR